MEETPPIRRLRGHQHALGIDLVDFALSQYLERGLKNVYPSWGTAAPPEKATVSGSPRLVLGIAGRNVMELSEGRRLSRKTLLKGDLCFVHTQSWNCPLHHYTKTFLTIDVKRDRIRYYLKQSLGPGPLPAELNMQWVLRAPDPCTRHLFAACEHVMEQEQRYDFLHSMSQNLIEQLLNELRRETTATHDSPIFVRMCDYIDEQLHTDIDRTSVAQAHAIHPNHVSRLFKQCCGQRFVDYLTEQRLHRASYLLGQRQLAVADIARRCGFTSTEYFCTVFKKHYAQTPGQYQKTR